MTISNELKQYAQKMWERRRAALGPLWEEAERVLRECQAEEGTLLRAVLGTLPLSDLGDYGPAFFQGFVNHALRVREEFPWCAALPEHRFFRDVLYPRINTEGLADCRKLFYSVLRDRVRGLSLREAILEVNRWCAEEAAYRSTDDRTASPLAVYRCGWGRCGEESTFAVTALRSVGIAARQVYAPWWSHCDDNHAWVEAFDGESWRFLGACEPEPALDRGWFTGAASRAMMVHARSFVQGAPEESAFLFPETDPVDLDVEHGVATETVTARYAPVKLVAVTVRDSGGAPLPGVRVSFSVLNMARFSEIASRRTDGAGEAVLRLGLGSVLVSAAQNGKTAEALLDTAQTNGVELILEEPNWPGAESKPFEFRAPADCSMYPGVLTAGQKQERRECLDRTTALRERKLAALAGKTRKELCPPQARIVDTLSEKDRASDIAPQVLKDAESAYAWEREYPEEVFQNALLSPRIGLDPLFPWREELSRAFSQDERKELRAHPRRVWDWVEENIRVEPDLYPQLPGGPAGVFRLRAGNVQGKKTLFCALCRSLGVPARLSPTDGGPEYFADGAYRSLPGQTRSARLALIAPEDRPGLFGQNYTLAKRIAGGWETLLTGDFPAGGLLNAALTPGIYRLLTVNRMPNGNQLAQMRGFSLEEGGSQKVMLAFREGNIADMLEHFGLPGFSLRGRDGTETESAALLERAPLSLFCFLEVNREPTEHILNELREAAEKFRAVSQSCALHLVLEGQEDERDPTLLGTLGTLPDAAVWYGDFPDTVPALARRMYVDPDRLPLILLADCRNDGLYACSGYNVGTAELLLRMIAELEKA